MLLCDPICPLNKNTLKFSTSETALAVKTSTLLFPLYTSDNSSLRKQKRREEREKQIKPIKFMSSEDSINQIMLPSMTPWLHWTLNVWSLSVIVRAHPRQEVSSPPRHNFQTFRRWICLSKGEAVRQQTRNSLFSKGSNQRREFFYDERTSKSNVSTAEI